MQATFSPGLRAAVAAAGNRHFRRPAASAPPSPIGLETAQTGKPEGIPRSSGGGGVVDAGARERPSACVTGGLLTASPGSEAAATVQVHVHRLKAGEGAAAAGGGGGRRRRANVPYPGTGLKGRTDGLTDGLASKHIPSYQQKHRIKILKHLSATFTY